MLTNLNSFREHNSEADGNDGLLSTKRLTDVFSERSREYINENNLFVMRFNEIPNSIQEVRIDCKKANKWFFDTFKSEIKDMHYNKRYYNGSKQAEYDDVFYFIYDDLLVDFDINSSIVRFLFRKTDIILVEDLISRIKKFKDKRGKNKPMISLLVSSPITGLDVKPMEITKPNFKIDDNYNDDFKETHQIILKRLSKKNDKGLVLLHGLPGTGKTSYIRHLCATLKKQIIFLSPSMAEAMTDPGLISLLIDNPNSIFVIEDAENIITDREKNGNSPVSALLNISDGLLSDCLNIQIICSFNTPLSKVDSALLRKGRLIAKYEFKELSTDKAQKLSDQLGFNTKIEQPMTLTAIYNQDEKEFAVVRSNSKIGFRS